MLCKRGLWSHAVSVRLSRSCILSIRINISSRFFPSCSHSLSVPNVMAVFRRGSPWRGRRMQVEWAQCRDCRRIAGYRQWWLVECEKQVRPSIVQFTAQTATHQTQTPLSWFAVQHTVGLQHIRIVEFGSQWIYVYSSILYHFRVIWRWIIPWPWNLG